LLPDGKFLVLPRPIFRVDYYSASNACTGSRWPALAGRLLFVACLCLNGPYSRPSVRKGAALVFKDCHLALDGIDEVNIWL
jgi:hypothetical protein